jgi:SdpC family antimicrobial peptide
MFRIKKSFQSLTYTLSLTTICLLTILFTSGCNDNSALKSTKAHQTLKISKSHNNSGKITTGFTGKQYYRAIAFGEGPVAEQIPYIRKNLNIKDIIIDEPKYNIKQKPMLKKAHRVINNVIDIIEKNNPKFFSKFKQKMESGNPLTIKHAMASALKLTQKDVHKLPVDIKAQKIMAALPKKEMMKTAKKDLNNWAKRLKKAHTNKQHVLKKFAQEIKESKDKYASQLDNDSFLSKENLKQQDHIKDIDVVVVEVYDVVTVCCAPVEQAQAFTRSTMAQEKVAKTIATKFNHSTG